MQHLEPEYLEDYEAPDFYGYASADALEEVPRSTWVWCLMGCGDCWCSIHEGVHTAECECPCFECWDVEGKNPYEDLFTTDEMPKRLCQDCEAMLQEQASLSETQVPPEVPPQ